MHEGLALVERILNSSTEWRRTVPHKEWREGFAPWEEARLIAARHSIVLPLAETMQWMTG